MTTTTCVVEINAEDVQVMLQVMNQVSFTGKAGAVQALRIIHALESSLPATTDE
jgi:hypothetical protein|tara:strand:- start:148 stop:309 length:162 start_codon:yes stop_codon:yes gene_type:complete